MSLLGVGCIMACTSVVCHIHCPDRLRLPIGDMTKSKSGNDRCSRPGTTPPNAPQYRKMQRFGIHVTTSELVVIVSVASVMCMVVLEKHGFVGEVAGKGDGGDS